MLFVAVRVAPAAVVDDRRRVRGRDTVALTCGTRIYGVFIKVNKWLRIQSFRNKNGAK